MATGCVSNSACHSFPVLMMRIPSSHAMCPPNPTHHDATSRLRPCRPGGNPYCMCLYGYIGLTCDFARPRTCPNECSGHGKCMRGTSRTVPKPLPPPPPCPQVAAPACFCQPLPTCCASGPRPCRILFVRFGLLGDGLRSGLDGPEVRRNRRAHRDAGPLQAWTRTETETAADPPAHQTLHAVGYLPLRLSLCFRIKD